MILEKLQLTQTGSGQLGVSTPSCIMISNHTILNKGSRLKTRVTNGAFDVRLVSLGIRQDGRAAAHSPLAGEEGEPLATAATLPASRTATAWRARPSSAPAPPRAGCSATPPARGGEIGGGGGLKRGGAGDE
jgi:hypothetical protein